MDSGHREDLQAKMQVGCAGKWQTRGFPEKYEKLSEAESPEDSRARGYPENLEKQLQTESSGESRSRGYPVKRNVTWEKSRKS